MNKHRENHAAGFFLRLQKQWKQIYNLVMNSARLKLALSLCGVLLIAGTTRLITNRIFYKGTDIADAFAITKSGCIESRLQVTADYGAGFLTEHDKQALAAYIANALNIQMEGAVGFKEDEVSQVYTYEKEARQAKTTIKVITLKEDVSRTYLYAELVIYNDKNYDILAYRDMILSALEELKVERAETTLQFLGAYEGMLAVQEWGKVMDSVIDRLDGKIVYENRDMELYTVYGYSSLLPEYISVDRKKINIQAAMRYEADNDRTVIYLATPMIRGDW